MERNKFTNKYFPNFFNNKLIKFIYKKKDTIKFIEKEKNLFNQLDFVFHLMIFVTILHLLIISY